MNDAITQVRGLAESLQQKNSDNRRFVARVQEQIADMVRVVDALKRGYKDKIMRLDRAIQTNTDCSKRLTALTTRNAQLEAQTTEHQAATVAEQQNAEAQLATVRQEIEQTKAEHAAQAQQLQQSQATAQQVQRENADYKTHIDELQAKSAALQRDIDEAQTASQTAEGNLEQLRQHRGTLDQQMLQLQAENDALRQEQTAAAQHLAEIMEMLQKADGMAITDDTKRSISQQLAELKQHIASINVLDAGPRPGPGTDDQGRPAGVGTKRARAEDGGPIAAAVDAPFNAAPAATVNDNNMHAEYQHDDIPVEERANPQNANTGPAFERGNNPLQPRARPPPGFLSNANQAKLGARTTGFGRNFNARRPTGGYAYNPVADVGLAMTPQSALFSPRAVRTHRRRKHRGHHRHRRHHTRRRTPSTIRRGGWLYKSPIPSLPART